MNRRELIPEAALSALAATALILLSGWSLRKAFERQNRYALERLQKPAVTMIERSYHLKDDLAIQQVVSALGQAPGIYFACVIGPDGKIMAHSQATNVGQTYHRSDFPVTARPLAEGATRWGTFVLSASEKTQRCAWWREMVLWSLGGIVLWIAWMARSLVWNLRVAEQDQRISDLLAVSEEQKQKGLRDTERHSQARARWRAWVQSAVDRLPEGMLFLDQRQRVIAANTAAARFLNASDEIISSSQPWSDVPLLRSCGVSLEQSLHSPGVEVKANLSTEGAVLAFTTLKNGSGTWVTFFPSKPVVK